MLDGRDRAGMRPRSHLHLVGMQRRLLNEPIPLNIYEYAGQERRQASYRRPLGTRRCFEAEQALHAMLRLRPASGEGRLMQEAMVDVDVAGMVHIHRAGLKL